MSGFRSKIEITSFIQYGGELIPLLECKARPSDSRYMLGAIRIMINDRVFIDESIVDYIDELWHYFIDFLKSLDQTGTGKLSFPDQPIPLTASLDKSRSHVNLHLGNPGDSFERRQMVTWPEFREAICLHAIEFFHQIGAVDSRKIRGTSDIEELRQRTQNHRTD